MGAEASSAGPGADRLGPVTNTLTRRTALGGVAGSVAVMAARLSGTGLSVDPGPYGSGLNAHWANFSPSLSTDATFSTAPVWMFGDSVAEVCQFYLATQLWAQRAQTLAVNNWPARPTQPAVDALVTALGRFPAPRQIIMASGPNDIFDPPQMAGQIDRAMSAAGSIPVFWMEVQVCRTQGTFQIADQRNTGWVNQQIHEATGRWPALHVVPWFVSLASAPGRLTAYLGSDGVHPNSLGVAFYTAVVLQALPPLH